MNYRPILFTVMMATAVTLSGCGSNSALSLPHIRASVPAFAHSMTIWPGSMDGRPGWPKNEPAFWSAHHGSMVILTIINHDDGTAPLMTHGSFSHVSGTLGGVEWVNGKSRAEINPQVIAHTFTVPALHINLAIPAAPPGGTIRVVARFMVPDHNQVIGWQCEAPCGTGPHQRGGAMMTPGYMKGILHVTGS